MSKQDVIYVTGMESCEFRYEWTVENFAGCIGTIESPIFSSHYSDFNDEWILTMNTDCRCGREKIYIPVELHLQSFNNTSPLKINCKISNDDKYELTRAYTFTKFQEKIRWDKYVFSSDLPGAICSPYQDGKLKICCTITMSKKPTNNSNGISTFSGTPKLGVDLKELLLNEKSADVTIKVGQRSFRAIKGILAVRSPVFSAMFDHEEFKENKKNEVVIEDVDEDVFEEFLHYIYTDGSPNVNKMPMELLAVAEKYEVICLKNICQEIICKTINFDNVATTLVFSDRYNLEKLNKKCLEFMKINIQDVLPNETFRVYKKKHPEVFMSVFEELLLSAKSLNIQFLRDLKDFTGVVFKLEPAKDPENQDIILEQVHLSCMDIGYNNSADERYNFVVYRYNTTKLYFLVVVIYNNYYIQFKYSTQDLKLLL